MASIGLYRYKIAKASAGKYPVFFRRNGVVEATQCVTFKPFCSGGKILKYMDRNGMYRSYPFNEYYTVNNSRDRIGRIDRPFTSLRASQGLTNSVGHKLEQKLTLIAYDVTQDELTILQDLFTSPFVYLFNGTTGDAAKDWLLVEVTGNQEARLRKQASTRLEVTVTMPRQFTVTRL